MNEYCMIETASDNKDEIKNIAKQLLDKKLVASCHIIESVNQEYLKWIDEETK